MSEHPIVAHVTARVEEHTKHVAGFEWLQDGDGNLRCPADNEIVVPSPEWLGY